MKHTIEERRYRKELDTLDFTIDDNYKCFTELYDDDCYHLTIWKDDIKLYFAEFDSDLGMVTGTDEYYTSENIQPIKDEAFRIISNYIGVQYTN